MYADDIVLVADPEVELQTMLAVVQAYLMRWRMKFNSRKSKFMVLGKREGGTSWKTGEEIMEEVEEFEYLGCGLIGNYEVMSTLRKRRIRQKSGLET